VLTRYKHLARQLGVWLSLGGLQETAEPQAAAESSSSSSSSSAEQILNCHIVINSSGEVAAVYRKAHLFDAPCVGLKESAFTRAGDALAGSSAACLLGPQCTASVVVTSEYSNTILTPRVFHQHAQ
jgi:predicted amidohydrolase